MPLFALLKQNGLQNTQVVLGGVTPGGEYKGAGPASAARYYQASPSGYETGGGSTIPSSKRAPIMLSRKRPLTMLSRRHARTTADRSHALTMASRKQALVQSGVPYTTPQGYYAAPQGYYVVPYANQ